MALVTSPVVTDLRRLSTNQTDTPPTFTELELLDSTPPPPYGIALDKTLGLVKCSICHHDLYVTEEMDQLINCYFCQRVTPTRKAPAGMKYVRCYCQEMLIVSEELQQVTCTNTNCRKKLDLRMETSGSSRPALGAIARQQLAKLMKCVYCANVFEVYLMPSRAFYMCTFCGKESCVYEGYIKRQVFTSAITAILFLLAGISLSVYGIYFFGAPFIVCGILALYYCFGFMGARTSTAADPAPS